MQSYAARRGFDAADYTARVAAIFAEGRIVGKGRATEEAAMRLAAGVPWQAAGTPPPFTGNGSAMRAGPIGLMFAGNGEALARAAVDQGRITHSDPRCAAGAVAIAGAVALALGGTSPSLYPERLAAWADPLDPVMAGALRELGQWLELPPAEAVGPISRAGLEPGYRDAWPGISPYVVGSVIWSLYAFLKSPGDYWESIRTAIAVGGDVDTTAAMTGAIAGARNGLAAVPGDLARRLNDNGAWTYDDLVGLADRVWEIGPMGG